MNYSIDLIRSDKENPAGFSREEIADFLHSHLDQYGDRKESILKCIAYAYGDGPGQDGFVLVVHEERRIIGTVIVNDTNMSGFIPEHILVYIAVHEGARGRGVGKALMQRTIDETDGSIALHVEPDNPARHLYEKYGFSSKYIEMRLEKS
ncbi:MAG: GNAT family N-acetyltransferase [Balneolaceae bacterium]